MRWVALIGLSFLAFTAFLDFTIVNTALGSIQRALHARITTLQWILNIFYLVNSAIMIAVGRVAELSNKRLIFYGGVIVFFIGALGAGLSTNMSMLILFRGIQAIGSATIFPVAVGLLSHVFPEDQHTLAVSVYGSITGLGLAVGPFIGGVLIATLSWRWVFFINLPIILVGTLFCLISIRPTPRVADKTVNMDYVGLILIIIGLGNLIFGIIRGGQIGYQFVSSWLTLTIGVIALLTFMIVEPKIRNPLIDFSVFRNAALAFAPLLCIAAGMVTGVFMFFDPLYLMVIKNKSAFITGSMLVSIPIIQILFSIALTHLLRLFSVATITIACLALSLGASIIQYTFLHFNPDWYILISFALLGFLWGAGNALSVVIVNKNVTPDRANSVIAVVYTGWNVSCSVLLAIAVVIFKIFERMHMHNALKELGIQLSRHQRHLIQSALSQPAHAKATLDQLNLSAHGILNAFQEGYRHGMHAVCGFASIFFIATLIIAFILKGRTRRT